jgi:hypothetical protein
MKYPKFQEIEQIMRKIFIFIILVIVIHAVNGIDVEIIMGNEPDTPWRDMLTFSGCKLITGRWGLTDIVLADGEYTPQDNLDLLLHFNHIPLKDETGNYYIEDSLALLSTMNCLFGTAGAAFQNEHNPILLIPTTNSIFSSGCQDFSIEFWLYPLRLQDDEVIFLWQGNLHTPEGSCPQKLLCTIKDRRIVWQFINFFWNNNNTLELIALSSARQLLPEEWHHHLLRFNSTSGLFEYLIDGRPEGIVYVTETGNEGSSVYVPNVSEGQEFIIGRKLTGIMDELRISRDFVVNPFLKHYKNEAGIVVSRIFDLKYPESQIKMIKSTFNKPENTEIYFYYKIADKKDNYYELTTDWIPFLPNTILPEDIQGRYFQLRLELLPDGTGSLTPSVSDITIVYEPDLPPTPPAYLIAIPGDGEITLKWQKVNEKDIQGYRIYFGFEPGNYYNVSVSGGLISSPIDVGNVTSYTITGLENGKLYYFTVTSYDSSFPSNISRFSDEVSTRPSRILP